MRSPTKTNTMRGHGAGTNKSDNSGSIFTYLDKFIKAIQNRISVSIYSLEDARQHYAYTRQLLKQAAACIALYFLRMVG